MQNVDRYEQRRLSPGNRTTEIISWNQKTEIGSWDSNGGDRLPGGKRRGSIRSVD